MKQVTIDIQPIRDGMKQSVCNALAQVSLPIAKPLSGACSKCGLVRGAMRHSSFAAHLSLCNSLVRTDASSLVYGDSDMRDALYVGESMSQTMRRLLGVARKEACSADIYHAQAA